MYKTKFLQTSALLLSVGAAVLPGGAFAMNDSVDLPVYQQIRSATMRGKVDYVFGDTSTHPQGWRLKVDIEVPTWASIGGLPYTVLWEGSVLTRQSGREIPRPHPEEYLMAANLVLSEHLLASVPRVEIYRSGLDNNEGVTADWILGTSQLSLRCVIPVRCSSSPPLVRVPRPC